VIKPPGDISLDSFTDGRDADFRVEGDAGPAFVAADDTLWRLVGIDHNWQVEVLPEIVVNSVDRPSCWHRLWFRIFFGWQWTRILAAKEKPHA